MPYSQFEQETTDLDLYFKDSHKNVHIASGGGNIPEQISLLDQEIESFTDNLQDSEINLEVEINPNLRELLNLTNDGYELYVNDFILNAKKGFYSYDKTNLGDFEDGTFHLIARPIFNVVDEMVFQNIPEINLATLPTEFNNFDINEVMNTRRNE